MSGFIDDKNLYSSSLSKFEGVLIFKENLLAKISIFDSALMFGDMVFEMTRSFGKKQFKLREHIDRLYSSIDHVKIPIDISKTEMEEICFKTIEKNESEFLDTDEHRLMINVSRGPLSIYGEIFNNNLDKLLEVIT